MKHALVALALCVTACDAGEAIDTLPVGTVWTLMALNDAPFDATATLSFSADGSVSGRAPCNRYTAKQTGNYPDLAFGPTLSTKMACPDLEQEYLFFTALADITKARVSEGALTLSDAQGNTMIFTSDG